MPRLSIIIFLAICLTIFPILIISPQAIFAVDQPPGCNITFPSTIISSQSFPVTISNISTKDTKNIDSLYLQLTNPIENLSGGLSTQDHQSYTGTFTAVTAGVRMLSVWTTSSYQSGTMVPACAIEVTIQVPPLPSGATPLTIPECENSGPDFTLSLVVPTLTQKIDQGSTLSVCGHYNIPAQDKTAPIVIFGTDEINNRIIYGQSIQTNGNGTYNASIGPFNTGGKIRLQAKINNAASGVLSPEVIITVSGTPPGLPSTYSCTNGKDPQGNDCTSSGGNPCKSGAEGVDTAIGCIPTEPTALVQSLLRVGIGAGGGIALLLMVAGAFGFITSGGNPDALKSSTERFTSAIIGLLIIVFSVLLLQIIGVDILNIPGFK